MAKGQFQKKATATAFDLDPDKIYEFELVQTHEKYKGTDEDGRPAALPYPESYSLPNTGVAYDEVTKQKRRFRFMNGINSIWEDEQDLVPTSLELADEANQIEFLRGKLKVRGIDQSKLAALLTSDYIEGKKTTTKKVNPIFRLINPDDAINASLESLDQSFEAETTARSASEEDMLAYAVAQGINTSNGMNALRKDFIMQAKSNPVHFLKHYVNPRNRFLLAFTNALASNEISGNLQLNQLVWTGTGVVITEINSKGDVAAQLADRAIEEDEAVLSLYDQLEKL